MTQRCGACGAQVEESLFCTECGARQPVLPATADPAPEPPPPPPPAMPRCAVCGAVSEGSPYCTECGARQPGPGSTTSPAAATSPPATTSPAAAMPAPPPPPTYAPPPPTYSTAPVASSRPGSATRAILITALAVVVAAIALLGGLFAWGVLGPDDDQSTDQKAPSTTSPSPTDHGPTSSEAPSEEPSETPSQTPSESPTGEPVTCWDGSTAPGPKACPELTGTDALAWVFPSLDPADPACTQRASGVARERWTCDTVTPSGSPAEVNYVEWTSVAAAEQEFARVFGGAGKPIYGPGGKVVFEQWHGDGTGVRLFVRVPYSVRVSLPNGDAAGERAVDVLHDRATVLYRPVSELP